MMIKEKSLAASVYKSMRKLHIKVCVMPKAWRELYLVVEDLNEMLVNCFCLAREAFGEKLTIREGLRTRGTRKWKTKFNDRGTIAVKSSILQSAGAKAPR